MSLDFIFRIKEILIKILWKIFAFYFQKFDSLKLKIFSWIYKNLVKVRQEFFLRGRATFSSKYNLT
jgi:hypothetical protein